MQIPTSSSQKCQPPEQISAPLPAFPNEPGRTVGSGSIREIGVQFVVLPIVYFSCLLVPSCQKKANKADWDGQSILDQRGSLEGCQGFYSPHDSLLLVGFFLTGVRSTMPHCLSCVLGSCCPPLCLLWSPGDYVCASIYPCFYFSGRSLVCVTCLHHEMEPVTDTVQVSKNLRLEKS